MIDFYYSPTPNGWKIAIMLEECELDYDTHLLRLNKGDQFSDEFLAISPNAKMPAIVDRDVEGEPVSVFESGAIFIYLAEKTGRFMPGTSLGRKETLEWLFWQAANQGPYAGQVSHFINYAPKGQDYSLKRYSGEYNRNLAVLENRLADREYILGDYSIADMMSFPWVLIAKGLGESLDEFPNVKDWRSRIKDRPAVVKAINLYKEERRRDDNAENNPLLFNQDASHLRRKK